MKKLIAVVLLVVCLFNVKAVEMGLKWDYNAETNVVSYKVYYGASSRNYTNSINVGKTNIWALPTSIPTNQIKFYAITAINSFNLESDFSTELSFARTNTPPNKPTGFTVIELSN